MLRKSMFAVLVFSFYTNLFAESPFGTALHLNGNQQYFAIPDTTYLNLDSKRDFTIEFWFKTNGSEPYNLFNKLFFDFSRETLGWYPYQGWFADINGNVPHDDITYMPPSYWSFNVEQAPGQFRLFRGQIRENGHGSGGFLRRGVLNEEWQHIAITINRSERKEIEYFNASSSSWHWSPRIESDLITPGIPFNIGGFPISIDSTLDLSFYFNGLIDEVRIWSIARTKSQIQFTMNDTLSFAYYAAPDSGLVAYYRFEQMENLGIGEDGLADDIRDLSYNANHGDLIGNPDLVGSEITTSVETEIVNAPDSYDLFQNYPNPFNPYTKICYSLPKSNFITLKVYDVIGKEIETLVSEHQPAGVYEVTWYAKDLPSGLYICCLQTEGLVKNIKMVFQK